MHRRQREKLFGVVMPSPVGLAMVNDVGPSPLNPSPACDGPFLTKMLTLTLKPGHYVLICNLPAHYKAGQHVDFTVG